MTESTETVHRLKVREMERDCAATVSVAGTCLAACPRAGRYLLGQATAQGAFVEGRGPTPEAAASAALAQLGRAYLAHLGTE